jgi:adenosylcobinamide kinase / adenosylcobinamide-phosphate guanylyltransferase
MKTLIIGGIKSGKSRLTEDFALRYTTVKPYYLAITEIFGEEMREWISVHQQRRQDRSVTVEEAVDLCRFRRLPRHGTHRMRLDVA